MSALVFLQPSVMALQGIVTSGAVVDLDAFRSAATDYQIGLENIGLPSEVIADSLHILERADDVLVDDATINGVLAPLRHLGLFPHKWESTADFLQNLEERSRTIRERFAQSESTQLFGSVETIRDRNKADPIMNVIGYSHIEELSNSSRSRVHRAIHTSSEQEVAIKIFQEEDSPDSIPIQPISQMLLFQSDPELPNIVPIYRCGRTTKGHPFVVLEYMDGGALGSRILSMHRDEDSFNVDVALMYALDMAEALAGLHQYGILHGDVNRANNFFIKQGKIKIGNFKLAHRLEAAEHPKTALSDEIKSFGTLLYTLFTGMIPRDPRAFSPDDWPNHVRSKYGIPAKLNTIILRAMHANTTIAANDNGAVYYRDAMELYQDLETAFGRRFLRRG